MNNLIGKIKTIEKKIDKSSGYNYLYDLFDDLVSELEAFKGASLSFEVFAELRGLIQDYAEESIYNTYGSANWVRYSARCFYCADSLITYLQKPEHESFERFLNGYFLKLVESSVAPVVEANVLGKYIEKNIYSSEPMKLYDILIRNAINESYRFRLWNVSEVSLARSYTQSVNWLIERYIKRYSDYSILKIWIPLLNTKRMANIWYEYPESYNYEHAGKYTRESVEKSLDVMLETHLSLLDLWYWHNPQEALDYLSLEDLIENLEVYRDENFKKTLCHMVTLPYNEKVNSILEHFAEDDEGWVASFCNKLLLQYKR